MAQSHLPVLKLSNDNITENIFRSDPKSRKSTFPLFLLSPFPSHCTVASSSNKFGIPNLLKSILIVRKEYLPEPNSYIRGKKRGRNISHANVLRVYASTNSISDDLCLRFALYFTLPSDRAPFSFEHGIIASHGS